MCYNISMKLGGRRSHFEGCKRRKWKGERKFGCNILSFFFPIPSSLGQTECFGGFFWTRLSGLLAAKRSAPSESDQGRKVWTFQPPNTHTHARLQTQNGIPAQTSPCCCLFPPCVYLTNCFQPRCRANVWRRSSNKKSLKTERVEREKKPPQA